MNKRYFSARREFLLRPPLMYEYTSKQGQRFVLVGKELLLSLLEIRCQHGVPIEESGGRGGVLTRRRQLFTPFSPPTSNRRGPTACVPFVRRSPTVPR